MVPNVAGTNTIWFLCGLNVIKFKQKTSRRKNKKNKLKHSALNLNSEIGSNVLGSDHAKKQNICASGWVHLC